jgi:lipopolysaccharide transport system permease protein
MNKLTTDSPDKMAIPWKQRHSVNTLLYHLDLILHLTRRNFLVRYKGSSLGVLWSLLVPLSQLFVLVFIFGKVVPLNIEAYPAFVLTALLPWQWFSNCLSSAGSLFTGNRDLVRKPNFASFTLVIVDVLVNLLLYLVFLPVLLVMLLKYGRGITIYILVLPLIMMIQAFLTTGLALIIGTLNVFYRDVQYIVTVSLMLLFYLTPVFYRSQNIAGGYRLILGLNPVGVLIDNYRAVLFYGRAPQWFSLFSVGVISAILCWVGYLIYRRFLHEVIDII